LPAVALVLWWRPIRRGGRERWLFFYVAGIFVYTILRAFANNGGFAIRADYVIAIEQLLFFGSVPSVELQRELFTPREVGLIDVLATGVHWSFFLVPHAAFAFVWFRRPELVSRFAGTALLMLYIGLMLFWLVPTVPPWLASRQGDLVYAFRVMDFVTDGIETGVYTSLYETLAEPNPVAAVPSIHMAWTFHVLLFARDFAPKLWWPLAGYNLVMAFSLVYLAEHYVFDVLMGVAVASFAVWTISRRVSSEALPGVRAEERAA
jgi:membrane-associated phospholipid phosphatase